MSYTIDRATLEKHRADAITARNRAQERVVTLTRRLDPARAVIEEAEYWRLVAVDRWKDSARQQARRRAELDRDAAHMQGRTPRRGKPALHDTEAPS